MSKVQIGMRLASLRMEYGLTQNEFAKKLGFDPSYISKIESGYQEPSFRFLKKAAKEFSVSPSYLVASDAELAGVATYTTEGAKLLAKFQQLSEEDKKSVVDFLKFILDQKRKRDALSEATR
jgi:transcriptional regulator with XRE-family HTH domain